MFSIDFSAEIIGIMQLNKHIKHLKYILLIKNILS